MRAFGLARYVVVVTVVAIVGCAGHPISESDRKHLADLVTEAIGEFRSANPIMPGLIDAAYGYVVFPDVGKAGAIFGGAHGDGQVFEEGELVGGASLSLFTVGAQVGGQHYREIILFEHKAALEDFKEGNFDLDAHASAVAIRTGTSIDAPYGQGVAVFTMPKQGLMAEAVVGLQKFTYHPY